MFGDGDEEPDESIFIEEEEGPQALVTDCFMSMRKPENSSNVVAYALKKGDAARLES
ncbi:MAG: hypothetical protein WC233_05670 [Sphaerochaeta sp.]